MRKMVLKNETKANQIFQINTEGPFQILKTKTNSGETHPLSHKATTKAIKQNPEVLFNLQPEKLLQITMRFLTPDPTNKADWPDIIRIPNEGRLHIAYSNSKSQTFKMLGNLLRPKIFLQTQKPSKNSKAQDELDLGEVNTSNGRTLTFFISNETPVPAHWTLNYIKFPSKSTMGYMTTTMLETENTKAVDNPDVFQFSVTQVSFLILIIRDDFQVHQLHFD